MVKADRQVEMRGYSKNQNQLRLDGSNLVIANYKLYFASVQRISQLFYSTFETNKQLE